MFCIRRLSRLYTKGHIGTAWKTGKVYDFLFSFLMVDFVLALHAAAKRCNIFVLKFGCEIPIPRALQANRQTTDGWAIAYCELEREFTFTKT